MSKIRVYELAKDLNMTNKELLKKIIELNIEVNSHMSSLEEESVNIIKFSLFGTRNEDKIEEKRIKPTVIRRRKKVKDLNKIDYSDSLLGNKKEHNNISKKDFIDNLQNLKKKFREEKYGTKNIFNEDKLNYYKELFKSSNENNVNDSEKKISKYSELKQDTSKDNNVNYEDVEAEKNIRNDKILVKNKKKINKDVFFEKSNNNDNYINYNIIKKSELSNNIINKENINNSSCVEEKKIVNSNKKVKNNKTSKMIINRSVKKKEIPAKIVKKASSEHVNVKKENKNLKNVSGKIIEKNNKNSDFFDRNFSKKNVYKKKESFGKNEANFGNKKLFRSKRKNKSKFYSGAQKTKITVARAIKRRIKIDETIVLSNLAKRLGVKVNEMIGKLMSIGVMVTANQTIDFDTACLIASEFDYEVERAAFEENIFLKKESKDDPSKMVQRPPVVTIMGHVDHGKTSLLDAIRKTRVTEGEAGGITQHIGAYRVDTKKGTIVFLDTPGHEAFSAMRSRGAKVTDIVVLVVAADDGVMPQTVEAINHSKASEVPIIIAINKIDKIGSNPERVLRELSEYGLISEKWGGEVISVNVSAKENIGIDSLLEMVLLQAEILELKANPEKLAIGHVVESRLDPGRGPVATVLIQEGMLKSGNSVICGLHYGKIRALYDDVGRKVDFAGPSMPVEIIGLSGVPMAGDELISIADEKNAKQVSSHRIKKQRSKELAKNNRLSLEGLFEKMKKGEVKDLNLIIKADVDGSIEAIKDSLMRLSNDKVNISVVHSATGSITESDISLAAVCNAVVIGFNVRPNAKVQDLAVDENVDLRFYEVIYDVIKDIKGAIVGMMDSTYEERFLGRASVRQVFHVPKVGTIAGCYIIDGKIVRGNLMRLLRESVIVYKGRNSSLRRFKDDVKEVQDGYECGIGIEKFNDIKVGDIIECYYMEEIKPIID